jgi:poly-gamma-glutamate synthesis protein (capsule biosynthesis protein)
MTEALTLALAGDTMLGRTVAREIGEGREVLDPDVVAVAGTAELFVVNLECCISDRGERWAAPGKPFFFRAPPEAAELLAGWGVDCVSLANNHALDFGYDALLDTLAHLDAAGVAHVGAGPDAAAARAPARVGRAMFVAATDHPADFVAGPGRPGVAYADLRRGVPDWLREAASGAVCLVHWGPNMVPAPIPSVRRAAAELEQAGAALVAGHSAHVPHGAAGRVLFDLGDFLDDYAVHPELRNDLGLLFLVRLAAERVEVEAVPLALDFCRTRLADPGEAAPLVNRFTAACAELGTAVEITEGRIHLVSKNP